MSSLRQIAANRRNALNSTGPNTAEGKLQSRRNALRHGLTAETVIVALEDAEDYRAFEAAIIADYDARTAVERELVLRLASVLWRLRRAITIETGLFGFQADHALDCELAVQTEQQRRNSLYVLFGGPDKKTVAAEPAGTNLARCFLGLADLPSYALDRLSRYEALLWRQARQLVTLLQTPGRRRPRERGRYFHLPSTRAHAFEQEEG